MSERDKKPMLLFCRLMGCRFLVFVAFSFFSFVPFPHVVEPGDVLVLGEELSRRLLLQVVRLARLRRHRD